MKTIRDFSIISLFMLFVVSIALNFNGCGTETPFQAYDENGTDDTQFTYAAKRGGGGAKYPQIGSVTLHPSPGAPIAAPEVFAEMFIDPYSNPNYSYSGGEIELENGSRFVIESGSLLPPQKLYGKDVTIQMRCDFDKKNRQLLFEFEPSGCYFEPAAEVWFKWSNLKSSDAKLYLIKHNGTYIEQTPDDIDYQGQRMQINIVQVSRYAVAFAN